MTKIQDAEVSKRAFSLAQDITRDIVSKQFSAGEFLGCEAELLTKYKVSRDVFREAVRQVEWLGIAKPMRGVNGGLYVQAPNEATVINLLRDYFDFSQAGFDDLISAREVLEQELVCIVCKKLNDRDLIRLRILLGQYNAGLGHEDFVLLLFKFYRELLNIADNSVLSLCLMPLIFVTVDTVDFESLSDKAFTANSQKAWAIVAELANAIIAGDTRLASKGVSDFLAHIYQSVPSKIAFVQNDNTYPEWYDASQSKLARNLVYHIHRDIRSKSLTVGEHLGTESELMTRYEVSRSTFREACRVLEFIGVVDVQRGRSGGLKVSQSRPDNVVSAVAYYLNTINASFVDIMEARAAIELSTIPYAAKRCNDIDIAELRAIFKHQQTMQGKDGFAQASLATQKALNHAGNNIIFNVFYDVLLDSIYATEQGEHAMQILLDCSVIITASQGAIVDAVCRGDVALARRRVIQHHQLIKTEIGRG